MRAAPLFLGISEQTKENKEVCYPTFEAYELLFHCTYKGPIGCRGPPSLTFSQTSISEWRNYCESYTQEGFCSERWRIHRDHLSGIVWDEEKRQLFQGKEIPVWGWLPDGSTATGIHGDQERKAAAEVSKELSSKNDVSLDNLPEETLATLSIDPEQDVSKVVEKKIMNEALSKALLRLPEKDQLLIYQYHFSGISMSELSRMYGVSRQIISRRIKRVYLKLKVMIE